MIHCSDPMDWINLPQVHHNHFHSVFFHFRFLFWSSSPNNPEKLTVLGAYVAMLQSSPTNQSSPVQSSPVPLLSFNTTPLPRPPKYSPDLKISISNLLHFPFSNSSFPHFPYYQIYPHFLRLPTTTRTQNERKPGNQRKRPQANTMEEFFHLIYKALTSLFTILRWRRELGYGLLIYLDFARRRGRSSRRKC
jgi:hypothetical protein